MTKIYKQIFESCVFVFLISEITSIEIDISKNRRSIFTTKLFSICFFKVN